MSFTNLLEKSSGDVLLLKNDLCRCCHAEGTFKDLGVPFFDSIHPEEPEVYSDMLRESMDINLMPADGFLSKITFKICDDCIVQLRCVSEFKKQVLLCESRFIELCNKGLLRAVAPLPEVKVEYHDIKLERDGSDEEDYFPHDDVGLSDNEEIDLKEVKIEEEKEQPKKGKGKAKPAKARPKAAPKQKLKKAAKSMKVTAKPTTETQAESAAEASDKPKKDKVRVRIGVDYVEKGSSYRCLRCDKLYNKDKLYSLTSHIKVHHFKIKPNLKTCRLCNEEFPTAIPFIMHKLEAHNIDDRHKCKACDRVYNKKAQLQHHMNSYHMLGEKLKCDKCDYETFGSYFLSLHGAKHKTVKNFHCKFCKKSFLRKRTLDQHVKIHTGDRRKVCNVCAQAFVQKASLNYHMAKYHPEVPF